MPADLLDKICFAAGIHFTTNETYLVDKIRDLRIGSHRYDKVRQLNARQFDEIFKRNVQGSRFDDLIDNM